MNFIKSILPLTFIILFLTKCSNEKSADQYFQDGTTAMKGKKYQEAKANFDGYIKSDSTTTLRLRTTFIYRGIVNVELENYDKAVEDYTKAMSIIPPVSKNSIAPLPETDILGYRAFAKLKMKDFKGVIEDCDELINRNSSNGKAFKLRSGAEKGLGMDEQATKDSIRAVELCADCPRQ